MSEVREHGGDAKVETAPSWQPLTAVERRVAGVLVEKAKTTPDSYPLSLNGLVTGCNQKSNRSPQMGLSGEDVEEVLESLREKGAVGVVQGSGRVTKYRHYMRDWLGVEGHGLAVVTELLLRGPQTIGELRGRAARMADIADLGVLRPILKELISKGLVVPLSVEGRGQVVTHGLYPERELERVRAEHGNSAPVPGESASPHPLPERIAPVADTRPVLTGIENSETKDVQQLRGEVAQLRQELASLRQDVEDLRKQLSDRS
ncbi:MAG: hypothetical protein CMJ81_03145 [Planctomycetaceae bacterium]|nr:hypothetical protein [Planctomycetaceae bacterium]MBP60177.1 hypothetical protein [Planctomycetaceae bacterium]